VLSRGTGPRFFKHIAHGFRMNSTCGGKQMQSGCRRTLPNRKLTEA